MLNGNQHLGIGLRIGWMGFFDGTDPVKGGSQKGTGAYISSLSNNPFNVLSYYTAASMPAPSAMGGWLLIGGLVTMCYGCYQFPWHSMKFRDGGHCVTMCGLTTTPAGNFAMRYRDPAGDEGASDPKRLTKQSAFTTTERELHPEKAYFDEVYRELYGIGPKPLHNNPSDPLWVFNERYAYIDAYQVIVPLFGMCGVSKKFSAVAPGGKGAPASAVAGKRPAKLSLVMSARFDSERGYGAPASADLSELIPAEVADIALDRIRPSAVVLDADGLELTEINIAQRTARSLARLPERAQRIVFGGDDGALFALMGDSLGRLEQDGTLHTVPVPAGVEAIGYDDASGCVIGAGAPGTWQFDKRLGLVARAEVPLRGDRRLTIQVDSARGRIMAMRSGDTTIRSIALVAGGSERVRDIALKDASQPVTFAIGPNDALLVNDGGRLREFGLDGVMNRAARLHDMAVGDVMDLPPATSTTPTRPARTVRSGATCCPTRPASPRDRCREAVAGQPALRGRRARRSSTASRTSPASKPEAMTEKPSAR